MRSPGWRRVGGSMVRGPGRGRVTAGATDVGRRETGSSSEPADTAAGALGAPTPASTGSGAETGAAWAFGGGAAAMAARASGGGAVVALRAAEGARVSRPTPGGAADGSPVKA